MTLNTKSIQFKFGAALLLSGLILLTIGVYSLFQSRNSDQQLENLSDSVIYASKDLQHNIEESNFISLQFINGFSGSHEDNREKIWENIYADLQDLQSYATLVHDKKVDEIITTIQTRLNELKVKQDEIFSDIDPHRIVDLNEYSNALNDSLNLSDFQNWINQQVNKNNDVNHQVLNNITTPIYEDLDQLDEEAEKRNQIIIASMQDDYNRYKIVLISILLLSFTGGITYFIWFRNQLKKSVESVNKPLKVLSKGDLPQIENHKEDELKPILDEVRILTGNFAKIKDFALDVGSGKFDTEIDVFNQQGEIGRSLTEMRDSLKKIAEEERERSWINEGFAKFGDILRQNGDNLEDLSEELISKLVKYLNANQGGIFILNGEGEHNKVLEMAACYAYERKKYLTKSIYPGDGLIGQCYLEQQKIYLKEIPQDYMNITSGLGGAKPDNLLIVPLKINEEVYGVMEIASFHQFEPYQVDFVEKLSENIASSISSVKINQNTKKLLEESQMAAEQLKAQEEEMRQNMEELAATQEEMKRNQDELVLNEAKARLIYENSFDGIITTDINGTIDIFNPAVQEILGYSYDEVKGKNVDSFVPGIIENHANIQNQVHELTGHRKNGESFPLRIKLEEGTVGDEMVLIIFLEDISLEQKSKEQEEKNKEILQEKEANLLALINSTNDTIFAIDKDYKILMVNNALVNKYKKSGIQLEIGANILEILPENLAAYWKEKYDRALGGEKYNYQEEQEINGEKKYIEVFLNPISNDGGDIIGTSVISRDITMHRIDADNLKLQLEELQKTKQQLIRDKEAFAKKLKETPGTSKELSAFITEQLKNQEYLLTKLSENEDRLRSAMKEEDFLFKKVKNK